MTGLVKAKKYDWKDSNMALFGSDLDRQVKKESAMGEPAWEGAGQEVGLQIWRIVKFQVTNWPKEDYGKFFSGDSYIVLHTYKPSEDSEELAWDVHFWIGKYSSQDEYGTAAYKTVELDSFLDDGPVQHREVQGYESEMFKSLFETMTIMEGGAETGFRHVEPTQYPARLLRFKKEGRKVHLSEVQRTKKNLTSDDVFILDLGLTIFQWNGATCSKDEKFQAQMHCQNLESERGKAKAETIEEGAEPELFLANIPDEDLEDADETDAGSFTAVLLKVSDDSGKPKMETVKEGGISMGDFSAESEDVFIFDNGKECFVWVGSGASPAEKKNGLPYAHSHLQSSGHPCSPITVVSQKAEGNAGYKSFLDAISSAA